MKFYPGYHQPSQAGNLPRAFISINRLATRKSDFQVNEWIMDSGAFTQLDKTNRLTIEEAAATDSGYSMTVDEYARQIQRWSRCGNLVAACAQDYMCEAFMFPEDPEEGGPLSGEAAWRMGETRGLSVEEHQVWTVDRYAQLRNALHRIRCDTPVMAVLQGYTPEEYLRCIELYETRWGRPLLDEGAYVGVGSVCKRNVNPETVVEVLSAIKERRPDLRLHGFGLKVTALKDPEVRRLLTSSDSMAWSSAARHARNRARKLGEDWEAIPSPNDWRAAQAYADQVEDIISLS